MMKINELPEVILVHILHWACSNDEWSTPRHHSLEVWKVKVELLSVCRIWRRLAFSIVHRTSFVRCTRIKQRTGRDSDSSISNEPISEQSDEHNSSAGDEYIRSKAHAVKSNFDMISSRMSGNICPRTILINVITSNDPVNCFRTISGYIRRHSGLLKSVQKLELMINLSEPWSAWNSEQTIIDEAKRIGNEITGLLPSVQFIKWRPCADVPVVVEFTKSLINGYAHQLTRFICPQVAVEEVHSFSDKLRHVVLSGECGSPSYMPKICAENLTLLDLNYIKSDFDWSAFESRNDSRTLHLDNLKWLHLMTEIRFNATDDLFDSSAYYAREFNYKIIAPRLETVIVWLCPFTLSFLSCIHGLMIMKNVRLQLNDADIHFTDFNLDIAREPFAKYAIESQDDYEPVNMLTYMTDILSINNLAEYAKSDIWCFSMPIDFERINWKYLHEITLNGPIQVSDMRRLIPKLPTLERANFNLFQNEKCDEIVSGMLNRVQTVEPVQSQVRFVGSKYESSDNTLDMDAVGAYLGKLFPHAQISTE